MKLYKGNCIKCKKFSKELQMAIVDIKNEKGAGLICPKCIQKLMGLSPTACTIEVNGKSGLDKIENIFKKGSENSEDIVYNCPHCTMTTTNRDLFLKHSCSNFIVTKDFAKTLVEDKK